MEEESLYVGNKHSSGSH